MMKSADNLDGLSPRIHSNKPRRNSGDYSSAQK
jgi:hypothetical protein